MEKAIENCVDAGTLANNVLSVQRRWSMEKLVDEFVCKLQNKINEGRIFIKFDFQFDMRINKDKKVRNSKWHVMPLTKEQQIYAAIDAYVSTSDLIY